MIPMTNFLSQVTFTTKILIVALDKSHVIVVVNDKEFWMKKKVN